MGNLYVGLLCLLLTTVGDESAIIQLTANEHPWGHFPTKSWRIVQTAIIAHHEGRSSQSLQNVKTTLNSIEANSLVLEESETLDLGGKIVNKKPQIVKVDFYQEPFQENRTIRQGQPAKLLIDKKVVPCAVRIYEQKTEGGTLSVSIWYTPHVYPYVMRTEKTMRGVPEKAKTEGQIFRQTITAVQTTSALKNLRSSRRIRTFTLQTIETEGNVTKVTDARCSWDVPGGLLESTTREFDSQNREIRRSISRMTNYFIDEPIPITLPNRYYRTWIPIEVSE